MKTVKTVWGSLIDSLKLFNTDFNIGQNITLNDKYDITSSDSSSQDFNLGYFSIGIMPDGYMFGQSHNSLDREVFKPVPFLIVPASTGLTPAQNNMYRIKVTKAHNGLPHIFCYLKKITGIDVDSSVYTIGYNSADSSFSLDEMTVGQNYTSPMVDDDCTNATTTSFYGISSKITMHVSKAEMDVVHANATDIYGINNPNIFEVGLYGGIEDAAINDISKAIAYLFKGITSSDYNDDGDLDIIPNIGGLSPI